MRQCSLVGGQWVGEGTVSGLVVGCWWTVACRWSVVLSYAVFGVFIFLKQEYVVFIDFEAASREYDVESVPYSYFLNIFS